ncbi:MAG: metallophosphoesterase [Lachnospiraceae bacterium]|nr:metallophosphoesterase [Lachnospiraceae bacterium]
MRILAISDTHGSQTKLLELVEAEGKFDLALHMGDAEGYEDRIEEILGCPLKVVRGNCDTFSDLPYDRVVEIGKTRFFMTHGHLHDVNFGPAELKRAAREKKCQVALYGHTHVPHIDYGDVIVMNPGSLSRPRQDGRKPSYIVMEMNEEGDINYTLKFLS